MKRILATSLFITLSFAGTLNAREKVHHHSIANPYLPLWEHVPDGEPHVFEDPDHPGKYRIYLIGSHDTHYKGYCGLDIRQWSAPVDDLSNWRDEGPIFSYKTGDTWDTMFAPDLVEIKEKDGSKTYYLYPHSRGPWREAMVAVGTRPDGPFTPINLTTDGTRTVEGSIMGFDPSVFVDYITDPNDPDYERGYRVYGYWGFQGSNAAELDPETMYSVRPGTKVIRNFIPASKGYGIVRDPEGTQYPCLFPGEDVKDYNFFEASSIRKVGNKYVLIYSGYSGPEYGLGSTNSTLRYLYADTPLGPWKSGGVLVDSRGPVVSEDGSRIISSNSAHNTHGSIEQINGNWYVFYHRPPRSFGFARQAVVAPITVSYDTKTVAEGGKVVIRGYDSEADDNVLITKASDGNEYKGAEVTSEGFNINGLDPFRYYSAGYACYLSDPSLMQDAWDVWNDHMTVAGMKSGDIVGYKYFGFGGSAKNGHGIAPFRRSKKGDNTTLNLFVSPLTDKEFTMEIWLDAPWDNEIWNGRKLGEITISPNINKYELNVSDAVDGLDGKHALYLRAKSEMSGKLCDFTGLGFSRKGKKLNVPSVPQLTITANGNTLEMPSLPVRCTNENGVMDYTLYEIDCPVNGQYPHIQCVCPSKGVKISVEQANENRDYALVKCEYQGRPKTYRINFRK